MKLNKSFWGGPPVSGTDDQAPVEENTNVMAAVGSSNDVNEAPYMSYGSSSYGHEESAGGGYPSHMYEVHQQPVQPLYLTGSLPIALGSISGGKDDELTVQQRAAAAMRAKAKSKK